MPLTKTEVTDLYENLRTTLLENDYDQDYKFIMGGDFNVPSSPQLDSHGVKTVKRDVVTTIHLTSTW